MKTRSLMLCLQQPVLQGECLFSVSEEIFSIGAGLNRSG